MPTAVDVAHLYRRAAFGASPDAVAARLDRSFTSLVDELLDTPVDGDAPPAKFAQPGLSEFEYMTSLEQWWYDRMAFGSNPCVEKLTLFWHGHFATQQSKVYNHQLMWGQNHTLRANALGNLRLLLKAVAGDPAMLRYLDNESNIAGSPNENFARELWELFMVGPGNYTQADVQESARAWTGNGLNADRTIYEFHDSLHDHGVKTVLGTTTNLDGPAVIDITLDGPTGVAAARFIATKLWTFYAYPDPEESVMQTLSAQLRNSGWDLRATLRSLLLMPEFLSIRARGALVRTPTEFIVAAMKASGLRADVLNPQWRSPAMGQQLFEPPDVSGWKTNSAWLDAGGWLARATFARFATWPMLERKMLIETLDQPVATAVANALGAFGVAEPTPQTRATLEQWIAAERVGAVYWSWANLVTAAMLVPEFHVA